MGNRPIEIRFKGKKLRVGELGNAIKELPRAIRAPALLHVTEFMKRRFMLYPRYKNVSRAKAYPEVSGFFSDKQRRFVMAAIADGRIKPGSPHRTQQLKRDWHVEGKGVSISLVNTNPAAVFAYHPIYQARQLDLVGWKDVNEMTEENQNDAFLDLEVWLYNEFPKEFDKQLGG